MKGEAYMTMRFALAVAVLVVVTPTWGTMRHDIGVAATAQQEGSGTQPQRGMQDMMKMHEQMMADMKASQTKLEVLTKDMNAASGSAKVDAMAAVVTELVRQQTAMHDRMGQMHEQMMSGRGMMGGRMMGR